MKWVATVEYRDPAGKLYTRTRSYEIFYRRDGKAIRPDQTRVIRDLVPQDCTTVSISIEKK